MGGRNVIKFIETHAPSACKKTNMRSLTGKRVVCDSSQLLHRYGRSKKKGNNSFFMTPNGKDISHIIAMLHSTINQDYNILVIHIFDGPSPVIKRATVDERIKKTENAEKELSELLEKEKEHNLTVNEIDRKAQLTSRSYKLTRDKIDECCQLLSIMGLPYMIAYEEADPQCAMLQRYRDKNGKNLGIYGVIGEDTDLLAYGCELVIRDFGSQNVSMIDTGIMLDELGLSYDEFVDSFIFSGVDYFQDKRHTKGISGMGIDKVYKILKKIKNNKSKDSYTLQNAMKIPQFTKLNDELKKKIIEDKSYHNILKIISYVFNFESSLKIPEGYLEELIKVKDRYTKTSIGKDPKDFIIEWNKPDFDKFQQLLTEKYKMSQITVDNYVKKLKSAYITYTTPTIYLPKLDYRSFTSCTNYTYNDNQENWGKKNSRRRSPNSWGSSSYMPASFQSYQKRRPRIKINDS